MAGNHQPQAVSRIRAMGAMGALIALAGLSLAACGKSSVRGSARAAPATTQGPGVPGSAVVVIKGWADALRAGQTKRAASYWALPSVMLNGTDAAGRLVLLRIDSEHDALLANASLPCGATLVRTATRGPYIQADFTLGARAGGAGSSSGCKGPARVDFLIRSGHIARWLRASTSSAPPPAGPSAPPGPGGAGGASQPI